MLLFCVKTIVKESCSFELARLKHQWAEGEGAHHFVFATRIFVVALPVTIE